MTESIFDENCDLIHFRMERFADYTNKQLKTGYDTELQKCFNFQESKIELMSSELINALTVSFCESLMLGECAEHMKQIKRTLPLKLKEIYLDYENWYDDLAIKSTKK